jgi:hypothetical protein
MSELEMARFESFAANVENTGVLLKDDAGFELAQTGAKGGK